MLTENAENFRKNNVKITFVSTDTVQNYINFLHFKLFLA